MRTRAEYVSDNNLCKDRLLMYILPRGDRGAGRVRREMKLLAQSLDPRRAKSSLLSRTQINIEMLEPGGACPASLFALLRHTRSTQSAATIAIRYPMGCNRSFQKHLPRVFIG